MRTGLWIPVEVEVLPLNSTEKYVLSEVVALHRVGECFASNSHFAELVGVRSDSISRIISKLKKLGYVKQGRFDGRHRVLIPTLQEKLPKQNNASEVKKPEQTKLRTQTKQSMNAEAAFAFQQSPSYIVHRKNKVQKNWDEFLKWSRERISKSSYDSILAIGDPDKLLGNSKSMWNMWSAI